MPDSILEWGINLILTIQANFMGTMGAMEFFTLLGQEEFFFFVLPIFFWVIDVKYGLRIALFIGVSNSFNLFFKVAFNDPRPYWYDTRVQMLAPAESGFGIPSGHAQNAVVVWGVIAKYFRRNWVTVLMIFLMIMIGLSRIFLAAHFPTDVIFGWILGIVILLLSFKYESAVVAWFNRYATMQKIQVAFGITLVIILTNALLISIVQSNWTLPPEWIANAQSQGAEDLPAPFSLNATITTISAIFGIIAGYVLLFSRGGYTVDGTFFQRLLRVVVGVVGVMVFMIGLDIPFTAIAPDDASIFGMVLRFIRYGLVGFWIAFLGPLTFIKLNIAKPLNPA